MGSNIVPHESALRARLRSLGVPEDEIGDIVQDAYLKIAKLDSVRHIRNGRAYFFATARTLLLDRLRRERIVRIDSMTELQALTFADDEPGPEQRVTAAQELDRVLGLIRVLPDRCREIFELRRLQGLPQREIAERLGLPEHTVEAQATRGLKLILKALAGDIAEDVPTPAQMRKLTGDRRRQT